MKQNYFKLKLVSVFTMATSFIFSQVSLEDALCNINNGYTSVTDTVPDMYQFNYDGTNEISDGGGDMYDGGNQINTDINTFIPYSDNVIMPNTDFGPNGSYFTRELPGLFVLAADIDGINSFYITGNNGADGSGNVDDHVFSMTSSGNNYDVFVKRVYGAGDPSINHMMIIPENAAATHTFSTDTNNDQHDLNNISGTTRIYYLLYSSDPANLINNTRSEAIAQVFMDSLIVPVPTVTGSADQPSYCEGDQVTLTSTTSGTGSTISWNGGVTENTPFTQPVGTEDYIVTSVTSGGCASYDTVTVTVNMNPTITLNPSDEMNGNDGYIQLTVTSGVAPFTFDWDNDGTGDNDDNDDLINIPAGTYTVVVTDANGCSVTDQTTVDSQVSLQESELSEVKVYPNPANNNVEIELSGEFNYALLTINGKQLMEGSGLNSSQLNLTKIPQGVYFIRIATTTKTITRRLVKQ